MAKQVPKSVFCSNCVYFEQLCKAYKVRCLKFYKAVVGSANVRLLILCPSRNEPAKQIARNSTKIILYTSECHI